MDKLLVLSNNCASLSESNGRIHSFYVQENINDGSLYNFYIRGNPDIDKVNYLTISNKNALLSKLSFGLIKPKLNTNHMVRTTGTKPASNKGKKPLLHLFRSFAFFHNIGLNKLLNKYIKDNHIEKIMIWGTNVPYLYRYAYLLSKRNNLKLITFTGEDYPLKNYNYMNKGKRSLFFAILQRSLRKEATRVYKHASLNIYATDDLKELYESKMDINSGEVRMFTSSLKKIDKPYLKKINRFVYGGNLNIYRAQSLCDVAEYLMKYKDIYIDVYGDASNDAISLMNKYPNIHYKGVISYNDLLKEYENADMLLHVEGFDPYYIKDCRYAFSTKISDYLAFGLPFFAYGPIEISGIKHLYKKQPEMVAINRLEFNKLDNFL